MALEAPKPPKIGLHLDALARAAVQIHVVIGAAKVGDLEDLVPAGERRDLEQGDDALLHVAEVIGRVVAEDRHAQDRRQEDEQQEQHQDGLDGVNARREAREDDPQSRHLGHDLEQPEEPGDRDDRRVRSDANFEHDRERDHREVERVERTVLLVAEVIQRVKAARQDFEDDLEHEDHERDGLRDFAELHEPLLGRAIIPALLLELELGADRDADQYNACDDDDVEYRMFDELAHVQR